MVFRLGLRKTGVQGRPYGTGSERVSGFAFGKSDVLTPTQPSPGIPGEGYGMSPTQPSPGVPGEGYGMSPTQPSPGICASTRRRGLRRNAWFL